MTIIKVIEAMSGEATFNTADAKINYKLSISGTPLSNITIFLMDKHSESNKWFLKLYCDNWNGSTVSLKAQFNTDEDSYTGTGDVFTENILVQFNY